MSEPVEFTGRPDPEWLTLLEGGRKGGEAGMNAVCEAYSRGLKVGVARATPQPVTAELVAEPAVSLRDLAAVLEAGQRNAANAYTALRAMQLRALELEGERAGDPCAGPLHNVGCGHPPTAVEIAAERRAAADRATAAEQTRITHCVRCGHACNHMPRHALVDSPDGPVCADEAWCAQLRLADRRTS